MTMIDFHNILEPQMPGKLMKQDRMWSTSCEIAHWMELQLMVKYKNPRPPMYAQRFTHSSGRPAFKYCMCVPMHTTELKRTPLCCPKVMRTLCAGCPCPPLAGSKEYNMQIRRLVTQCWLLQVQLSAQLSPSTSTSPSPSAYSHIQGRPFRCGLPGPLRRPRTAPPR